MKIQSLQNPNEVENCDEKKEIIMDHHPKLKIFRFKHLKTSLEDQEMQTAHCKFGSQEKDITQRKSSLEVYTDERSKSR